MARWVWRRQRRVVVPATSSSAASASASPTPRATPKPAKLTDPLTGEQVSDHEVIAAKVENIGLARPQVGLSKSALRPRAGT